MSQGAVTHGQEGTLKMASRCRPSKTAIRGRPSKTATAPDTPPRGAEDYREDYRPTHSSSRTGRKVLISAGAESFTSDIFLKEKMLNECLGPYLSPSIFVNFSVSKVLEASAIGIAYSQEEKSD